MDKQQRQIKSDEFSLVVGAPIGYRSREDQTMLPPGVLVAGSQNVLTNTAGRIASVKGYTLDGTASVLIAPILSSVDWKTSKGFDRHLRAGFLTSAGGDGKLQFRYVDEDGNIEWVDLMIGLNGVNFNFVDFWDTDSEKLALLLFVNGEDYIYEWSGGVTTFASATVNTITKEGTTTWAEEGFYINNTRKITIGGIEYTYTGGETTTTLTGVSPDPTSGGHSVGDIIFQTPRSTQNSAMTGLPLPKNDLIGILNNQVYVADFNLNDVYVSKINDYTDYSFSSPRVPSEGAILNLGETPTGFAPQESDMYLGTKNQWYFTKFDLSSDLQNETLTIAPLKTAPLQGPFSQALITKDKNNVVYVSNEPVLSSLGRVQNILQTPQILDLSFSIVDDMNAYDFTDGSVLYHKNFIYVAIPQHSLIRIYNQTDPANVYWEAPVTYPISRFSVIDGELYGHSYLTSESYKLFNGYNFNGGEILSIAKTCYANYGERSNTKGFNEYYVEGYISANTELDVTWGYDIDGCQTLVTKTIEGDNRAIVCIRTDSGSLGKESLGKLSLGGGEDIGIQLPPKFRVIKTMPLKYFYEQQTTFTSLGLDQQWELICHGPKIIPAKDLSNNIKQ